ncbi:MAG: flagellar hook-length control protein FliK [Wolinella sp.]
MLYNLIQSLSKGSDSHKIGSSSSSSAEEGELFTSLFKDAISALENGAKSGKSLFSSLFGVGTQKGKISDAKKLSTPLLEGKLIEQKKIQKEGDSPLLVRLQAPSKKGLAGTERALKSLIFEAKSTLEKNTLSNQKIPLIKEDSKGTKVGNRKVSDLFKLASDSKLNPVSIKVETEQITQTSQKELAKKPAKPLLKHSLDGVAQGAQKAEKEAEIPAKEPKETLKNPLLDAKSHTIKESVKTAENPMSKEIQKEAQAILTKAKTPNVAEEIIKPQVQNPELEIAHFEESGAKIPTEKNAKNMAEPKGTTKNPNIAKEKIIESKIVQDSPEDSQKSALQTPKKATQATHKTPALPIAPKKQEQETARAEPKIAHNHEKESAVKLMESPKEVDCAENIEPKTPHNLAGILQFTKKQKRAKLGESSAVSAGKKALSLEESRTKGAKPEESPQVQAKDQKHTPASLAPKENIALQGAQSALDAPHEESSEPFRELLNEFAPSEAKEGQKSKNGEASELGAKKPENTAPNEPKGLSGTTNDPKGELALKSARAKETLRNFTATLKDEVQNYKPPLTKLSIELNPENLGSVELTITQRGQGLLVQVLSNPQAIALFMNNHAEFKQQLANAGFNDVSMSFSDGSGGEGSSFGGGFQHSGNREQEKRNKNGLSTYKANALGGAESEDSSPLSQMEIILPKYA